MPIELKPVPTKSQADRARCIRVYNEQGPVRFVVTHVNKDGMRTLTYPAQGRFTLATKAEAEEWLANMLANNSAETLEQIFGHPSRGNLEVRPIECWPEHFDPKRVWFD